MTGPAGQVVTDLAKALGGAGSAPTPGWLLRAALAACDASVVAVEAASEDRLREIAERAEARSAVRDAIARAVPTTTEIVVG